MKVNLEIPKLEIINAQKEVNDLLTLYLDSSAADDTQDRRNKISATKTVNCILNNSLN